MAVIPTIEVIPMTTPSTVSADRILLVRTVSNAMMSTSRKRASRMAIALFLPQRFDRIETRGARGRVEPEEQSDQRRNPDAERHRPSLDGGRHRCERRDGERNRRAEQRADDPAEHREDH